MDAATAAMRDPDRNRWFRRRWCDEPHGTARSGLAALRPGKAVELTGRELLEQWRRKRARQKAGAR
jgi:hypothetical protein